MAAHTVVSNIWGMDYLVAAMYFEEKSTYQTLARHYLVGGLEHSLFFHMLGIIIPVD